MLKRKIIMLTIATDKAGPGGHAYAARSAGVCGRDN